MKLFIDGEWNSYKGELISMALVDENGVAWYESLGCENPDPWIVKHVMPIINKLPISLNEMQERLHDWLNCYDSIHIIADWPEDIQHFCELLIVGPGTRINTPPLTMEIRRDLEAVSALPHNALEDARAMRLKYIELTK